MKTVRFILIFSLCIFFIGSCKKDNDIGGGDIDGIPSGKMSFSEFGMKAYFPENEWGKEIYEEYKSEGLECIGTYLKESGNQGDYSVFILFMRFISSFENGDKANEKINEIKDIYDGLPRYSSVSGITSTKISNYNASMIKSKTIEGSIEESYYIYRKNRLYRIDLVMPEDKVSTYYTRCMEIINTLEITDK